MDEVVERYRTESGDVVEVTARVALKEIDSGLKKLVEFVKGLDARSNATART